MQSALGSDPFSTTYCALWEEPLTLSEPEFPNL